MLEDCKKQIEIKEEVEIKIEYAETQKKQIEEEVEITEK